MTKKFRLEGIEGDSLGEARVVDVAYTLRGNSQKIEKTYGSDPPSCDGVHANQDCGWTFSSDSDSNSDPCPKDEPCPTHCETHTPGTICGRNPIKTPYSPSTTRYCPCVGD